MKVTENEWESPPVVGFAGYSNSGKTTVMSAVIARLTASGWRVGTLKHDVHGFSLDRSGKDTWRHREAGAAATVISSPKGIGIVMDTGGDTPIEKLLPIFGGMDMVLVEGYKRAGIPKIEVYRPENGQPPACRGDRCLVALVSDADLDWGVPRFGLSDYQGISDFIAGRFLTRGTTGRSSRPPDFKKLAGISSAG